MENQELNDYISHARAQGLSDAQIKLSLTNAGWPESEVNSHLSGNSLAIPVPHFQGSQGPSNYHLNMWVVYQYILLFITLAVSSIALAGIAHNFINENFGTLNRYSYTSYLGNSMILGYVASLIVAFPIFAALFIFLRKKIDEDPEIRNIKSRKFFVYIALLWTFIVLMTRLISTIYGFLNGGENGGASILHLLVTLLISGSIFFYFTLDVRKGIK